MTLGFWDLLAFFLGRRSAGPTPLASAAGQVAASGAAAGQVFHGGPVAGEIHA